MIFLTGWWQEVLGLVIAGVFCHYIYYRLVVAKFWSERNVQHSPPRYYGDFMTIGVTRSFRGFLKEMYDQHKDKRVFGIWQVHKPVLLVFDPQIIKNITTTDFSYFTNRFNLTFGDHDPLMSENLVHLNGHAWRDTRYKLTPSFSSGKMKMMFPTMMGCGRQLTDYLRNLSETGAEFRCKDVATRFIFTVIGTCAFGIETNAMTDPDSEFCQWGHKVFNLNPLKYIVYLVAYTFPCIINYLKLNFLPKGTNEFFIGAVEETINYRKENKETRNDFMQLLIQLMDSGKLLPNHQTDNKQQNKGHEKMMLEAAAAHLFTFFTAGYDSTATTMTCALYELARFPIIQRKLKDEIKEATIKSDGELTYDALMKLEYLDCIIQETLRKYPTFPAVVRTTSKDYYMREVDAVIPKETMILAPICGLHHDPEYFPQPEVFDPERFSEHRRHDIPAFCYMPFGEGPRNCIAFRFGILQAKVGLLSVMKNYTVVTTDRTPIHLIFSKDRVAIDICQELNLKLVPDNP